MKVFIKGLNSCAMRKGKLKQYAGYLEANGHEVVGRPEESDTVLLWTCAFRGDVRDNSIAEIRRYQRDYKAELLVVGCLPDIDMELLRKSFRGRLIHWRNDGAEMEAIFGNAVPFDRFSPVFAEESLCGDPAAFRREHPDRDVTFHDQFIKVLVSEGCNYTCTYCSERLALPPYRSFPPDALKAFCAGMIAKSGGKEVILLADSLGDYGIDIGSSLPELVREIISLDGGIRVALNNLNPEGFIRHHDALLELVRDGHIRHLNLPIQSASDRILRLMERPYTKADIDRVFGALNALSFREFDTHIIVGFPTESEDDFEETISLLLRQRPKYVLASAFMESPAMAAYRLAGKVPPEVKRRRLRRFEEAVGAAGIICNADDSELSAERFRRLNRA